MDNIKEIEKKWQDLWESEKTYHFDQESNKPIFSIDNPPRYCSGHLHIGHAVHYTHIDFVARYKRMRGYNVFFPLCFDGNGMPIEVNVEKKYGIKMRDTNRQEFVKLCDDFANENIDSMTDQFKILGESMDPSIYYQTHAKYYREITQKSFIRMYKQGLVYKGEYPVNWCPRCGTAIADAEIVYETKDGILNYIVFKSKEYEDVTIATTRPELLCTCQLVAIHPDDEENSKYIGKTLIVPIYGNEVKVVADKKVDMNFGTGIVMICTIGDKDDLEWVYTYDLTLMKGIDEEGVMTEISGKYNGLSTKDARNEIIEDIKKQGLFIKDEKIKQNVGTCWRCNTSIELIQKEQWFIDIRSQKERILKDASVSWFPKFMRIRLEEWVNSLKWDWVVSRQRYFATPIPVWECKNGHVVVANEEDCYTDPTIDKPPVESCPECGEELIGCEHVFDTWVDSSISALYNTFWQRDEKKFEKMYPMSLRPQAHDIIRTWAFYSMMRCNSITNKMPWKDIMIDGFILGPDGRPMHTSWGNVVNPLEIIEEYGTDAFRYYATQTSLGEDTNFRYKDVKRGQKLITKLWNLSQFIKSHMQEKPEKPDLKIMDKWILSKYSEMVKNATSYLNEYKVEKAVKEIEYFMWHEFADHYIEMVKHNMDESGKYVLYNVGLGLTKLFAPFLPHITEEIYQEIFRKHESVKSVHISEWPKPMVYEEKSVVEGDFIKDIIADVRRWKADNGKALNEAIPKVEIISQKIGVVENAKDYISNTLKIESLVLNSEKEIVEKISQLKPKFDKIGPVFKDKTKDFLSLIKKENPEVIYEKIKTGSMEFSGIKITEEFVEPVTIKTISGKEVSVLTNDDVNIVIY